MDYEYLQNVMGSPFVKEGAMNQLKAKAAQAMGAVGAMAGHQFQNPTETKVRSLWEGFVKSLSKLMHDWEDQISPMFDAKVQLDANGQQIKDALDSLAQSFQSSDPQKIGQASNRIHDPSVRNQRDNPNTYVQGSAYNRSTTTPTKLKELAPALNEGFWDAANRDMGVNKKIGSDPKAALNSYKNQAISLWKNFMKDAMKATKLSAQQIYYTLSKMQPDQSGWQAPANMQKIAKQLQTLQSLPDTAETAAPGTKPPVMNSPTAAAKPTAAAPPATPPTTPPTAAAGAPGAATPSGGAPSGPGGPSGTGSGDILPQELPYIINHAITIIIDAVSSDAAHAGRYFSVAELPNDFGQDSLTKEAAVAPTTTPADAGEEPDEKEHPGEFIYNFHSKFRKYPGQDFSIQVVPVHVSDEVPELPGVKIEVWWECENTKNKIHVVSIKNGKKSKPLLLMQFFDQSVNSKAGATTPGHSNLFSIEKIMKAADPTGPDKLDPVKFPPEVKSKIKAKENKLLRSLMLITVRKSKEFKRKKPTVVPLTFDEKGNVSITDTNTKEVKTISKAQVAAILNGTAGTKTEAQKLYDSLDHYDYFEKNSDVKPKTIEQYPEYTSALHSMIQGGSDEKSANTLLANAWMGMKAYINPDDITAKSLINAAKGIPEDGISPELSDAAKTLKGASWKSEEIEKYLPKVWKSMSGKNPSANEIAQAAIELKKAAGKPAAPAATKAAAAASAPTPAPSTPVTAPVSGTAGGPPPSSPVSAPASGPAPTAAATAPVSNDPSKPAAPAKDKPKKKGQPVLIWKHKDGNLLWQNKNGQIGGLSSKAIQKLKDKPEFIDALKKAKEGGFKAPEGYETLQEGTINPFCLDNFLS